MYGAAWSMVAGFVAKLIVAAAASTYLYPLPWEFSKIARTLACAAAVVWVDLALVDGWLTVVKDLQEPGRFFQRVEWINLAVVVSVKLLLVASMIPLLWLTRAVSTRELTLLVETVRGKIRSWRRR
jgi:hypothetical protein